MQTTLDRDELDDYNVHDPRRIHVWVQHQDHSLMQWAGEVEEEAVDPELTRSLSDPGKVVVVQRGIGVLTRLVMIYIPLAVVVQAVKLQLIVAAPAESPAGVT